MGSTGRTSPHGSAGGGQQGERTTVIFQSKEKEPSGGRDSQAGRPRYALQRPPRRQAPAPETLTPSHLLPQPQDAAGVHSKCNQ